MELILGQSDSHHLFVPLNFDDSKLSHHRPSKSCGPIQIWVAQEVQATFRDFYYYYLLFSTEFADSIMHSISNCVIGMGSGRPILNLNCLISNRIVLWPFLRHPLQTRFNWFNSKIKKFIFFSLIKWVSLDFNKIKIHL